MIISISAEIKELQQNNIRNQQICKKYSGSEWVFHLYEKAKHLHRIVTCDVALDHVKKGVWNAGEVYVIQHMDDSISSQLISFGSIPFLILSFESPLYQGGFYDNAKQFINNFKYKILFNGLILNDGVSKTNFSQVRFPSYSLNDISFHHSKNRIDKIVTVYSNQYMHHKKIKNSKSLNELTWAFRKLVSELRFGSHMAKTINHSQYQLHDKRLELTHDLLTLNFLDLYGRGWNDFSNLPDAWQKKLKKNFKEGEGRLIDNKLKCLARYRFCLCIENFEYPGYITEKIIHCMVAKSIPIYYGAPNIKEHIPSECYIDAREFENVDLLVEHLLEMNKESHDRMVFAGQEYLNTFPGNLHSYEGFADHILSLLKQEYS